MPLAGRARRRRGRERAFVRERPVRTGHSQGQGGGGSTHLERLGERREARGAHEGKVALGVSLNLLRGEGRGVSTEYEGGRGGTARSSSARSPLSSRISLCPCMTPTTSPPPRPRTAPSTASKVVFSSSRRSSPGAGSSRDRLFGQREGRDVSGQYGGRDERCPVSTGGRGEGGGQRGPGRPRLQQRRRAAGLAAARVPQVHRLPLLGAPPRRQPARPRAASARYRDADKVCQVGVGWGGAGRRT